jgi:hypothetical protein
MADTGSNHIFVEDFDPTSILYKEYLLKFIYCSNRLKDFTTKLSTLLDRIENVNFKILVQGIFEKMNFLVEEIKVLEKNEILLVLYIKKINELCKLSQEFDSILYFYSYQPKKIIKQK